MLRVVNPASNTISVLALGTTGTRTVYFLPFSNGTPPASGRKMNAGWTDLVPPKTKLLNLPNRPRPIRQRASIFINPDQSAQMLFPILGRQFHPHSQAHPLHHRVFR